MVFDIIVVVLNDDLTAFKLDEALSEIGVKTKDETVKQVVDLFWWQAKAVMGLNRLITPRQNTFLNAATPSRFSIRC